MIQPSLFSEELISKEKLSTNLTANHHAIHRWFNITAGFSPEFVHQCVHGSKLTKRDTIIEPFAGLGTTLVQANFEGIPSIGFEAHPFFHDLTRAKIDPPLLEEVEAIKNLLASVEWYTGNLEDIWGESALKFLAKLIPENYLRSSASALLKEQEIGEEKRPFFRLVVSRTLEATSGSQTDGIYKAPTTKKRSIPFQVALQKVCEEIQADLLAEGNAYSHISTLNFGSSETMQSVEDASCSLCVTSPPYLNNFDFAEMTRMELYFWRYAGSWGEITERVRRNLIVNTTTVPTDLKRNQEQFSKTLSLTMKEGLLPVIERLEIEKRSRAGKKEYDLLVYPYFSQMQSVIRELRRVLKDGASLHLVVADAALYGVHVETEKFLKQLMQESGFENIKIERLRNRGHRWVLAKRQGAKKPLGEFHIHAR